MNTCLLFLIARLDRDGNEISTDEEEEYERNRAHMRARAQALAGGISAGMTNPETATLPPPPPSHQRYSYIFSPDTRSELSSDIPTVYDPSTVRVRLGQRSRDGSNGRLRSWQRGLRRTEHTDPPRREPVQCSVHSSSHVRSLQASPIPWSPVDLTPTLRNKERRTAGKVRGSARSPLAGR